MLLYDEGTMHVPIRRAFEPLLLLLGDLFFFVCALFLTLTVRYMELPTEELFLVHVAPFLFLFIFSVTVYFIAGLYDKQLVVVQQYLPQRIFRAQLVTVVGGAIFFFLIPVFGIAPKTNLLIYLLLSWLFVLFWRLVVFPKISTARYEHAFVIGEGAEVEELVAELNSNARSRIRVREVFSPEKIADVAVQESLRTHIREGRVSVCIVDTNDERFKAVLPFFYNLLFLNTHVRAVDVWRMYEQMFDRIALSELRRGWFVHVFMARENWLHVILKRAFDFVGSLVFGALLLIMTPFIYVAMRLEDSGPLFIAQQRIGRHGAPMTAYKFRTMSVNETASDKWIGEGQNKITRVGAFLRRFSIDEFPQVWNIFKGELSLIGPRNDIVGLGARLAEAIPYYNTRYAVTPGISGWAQINQHYAPGNVSPQSIEETEVRLAFDLYYIKHRSFMLDMMIALKTLRRMFFR